ncbi:PIG-L deacetylase family protein [Longispora albida]|uniref:PIG-L deacetylase family protein n=1 Tax=Longispora albida TaxID=203523 RepID=UPI000477BD21|nr:PIG-L family deacetylase [Longispora albida]
MALLERVERLTALAPHPDDIEIAAGGLLLKLRPRYVHYVLFTGSTLRVNEARSAARAFLPDSEIEFTHVGLPDGRLPAHWSEAKRAVEDAAGYQVPDLVLAPSTHDAHQDHRLIAELSSTAFRGPQILHYEIPKWDGDLGRPNVYVPLDEATARRKVELLHKYYPSQHARDWWDDEFFLGLARLRGAECRQRYAEAFTVHKLTLELS